MVKQPRFFVAIQSMQPSLCSKRTTKITIQSRKYQPASPKSGRKVFNQQFFEPSI